MIDSKPEMICILNQNQDPYFNLAAEEYLLKNSQSEYFMLWRCDSAVVVGKHQNALAEINYPYVKKNNINVARRLTGGGSVFHDPGNVNFTFIQGGEKGKLVDFKRFITPILEMIQQLGIQAEQGMKNEILLHGKKISGNAEHVFKSRILHHGTLLFSSQLTKLNEALKVIPGKYKDKAVQSNRSEVTNILQYLNRKMKVEEFMQILFSSFLKSSPNFQEYRFNPTDIQAISNLAMEKYKTWDWIYGYSPRYSFNNKVLVDKKFIDIELNVENGIIQSAQLSGNYLTENQSASISRALEGVRHREDQVSKVIQNLAFQNITNFEIDKILESFF